jgi:hypothetical protein
MGYEDAPGTKMLAVFCAACSKDLLDSISVETGMGPHCRAKHGLPDAIDEETREAANKLVHFVACHQADSPEVREALDKLEALGCDRIVARIAKRLYGAPISAWLEDGKLVVKSPFSRDFLDARRSIRSGRWDGGAKVTTFDPGDHRDVAAAIMSGYHARARIFIGADKDSLPEVAGGLSTGMFDAICDGYVAPAAPPAPPTPVKVVRDAKTERVAIACPYDRNVVEGMKEVEGRRWDGANKLNTFPLEAEGEVLDLIRGAFARVHVVTEEGKVAKPKASRGGYGGYSRKRGYGGYGRRSYAYSGNGGRCEDAPCCGCCS